MDYLPSNAEFRLIATIQNAALQTNPDTAAQTTTSGLNPSQNNAARMPDSNPITAPIMIQSKNRYSDIRFGNDLVSASTQPGMVINQNRPITTGDRPRKYNIPNHPTVSPLKMD